MNSPYESNVGDSKPKRRGKAMSKQMLEARLAEMDCNPVEGLAKIGMNKVECTRCDERHLVSHYAFLLFLQFDDPLLLMKAMTDQLMVTCPECVGSGIVQIPVSDRRQAYQALLDRMVPKLAAAKIEAEVRRPVVVRAHAMDEDAEQNRVRNIMSLMNRMDELPEDQRETMMDLLQVALGEDIPDV